MIILKDIVPAVVHIPLLFLGQIVNVKALAHCGSGTVGNGRIEGGKLDAGSVDTRYGAGSILAVVSHVVLFGVIDGFLLVILFHKKLLLIFSHWLAIR